MKKVKTIILLLFTFLIVNNGNTTTQVDNQSILVIKTEADSLKKIEEEMSKNHQFNIEYVCRETGLMVLKFSHKPMHTSDLKSYIRSYFSKNGVTSIDILFVETKEAISKC